MNVSKLTVAIPTYNREAYLRETLESITRSSYTDIHVILFDNASPYPVEKFIREFSELKITVQKNDANIGNQENFKRVMAYPFVSPYVCIFHDDDTVHPQYFETAVRILTNEPAVAWVGSFIARKRSGIDDMSAFSKAPDKGAVFRYGKQELADAFMNDLPLGFPTVVYRKEALARTAPDAARFHKWLDRPYMLESLHGSKAAVCRFPYVNYRVHPSQDSAQPYREHLAEMQNLIAYFVETGSGGRESRMFAARSTLCTAAANARSIREWCTILREFQKRGLFRFGDIGGRALYFAARIIAGRIYRRLLKR